MISISLDNIELNPICVSSYTSTYTSTCAEEFQSITQHHGIPTDIDAGVEERVSALAISIGSASGAK